MDGAFRLAAAEARRQGRFVLCGPALGRSYPGGVWQSKMALARLGLHAGCHDLGVSRRVPQCGSFVPRGGGGLDCLAIGGGLEAPLFRRDGSLLPIARSRAGRRLLSIAVRDRSPGGRRSSAGPVLARASRTRRGWLHVHNARHAGESGGISASARSAAGLRVPHRAHRGGVFPGRRHRVSMCALGKYQGKLTGENSLFRTLHPRAQRTRRRARRPLFQRVVRSGRDLPTSSAYVVVRKHQMRATDFRTGQRLGKDDHLVCWKKPCAAELAEPRSVRRTLPDLPRATGGPCPRAATARIPHSGTRRGHHLTDAEKYLPDEIAKLYRRRWQAELNLCSLKVVLQMDHLRCQTPHRVRNEFYMHLARL